MTTDPHPIDVLVGKNLRRLRKQAGLSQAELGARIGVSAQQVQKYETARNRISASKLWECALANSVAIDAFFLADQVSPSGAALIHI